MTNLKPRIYVACLAAYNNGYLHGEWIDANQDLDSLWGEVKKILASSPIPNAEEFAIHDYEGFGEIRINEYTGLETVANYAEFLAEHGELGANVFAYTDDIDEARKLIEECYHGWFDSEEDFAYYWTHEVDGREIPNYLRHYIDYKAMAHDYFIDNFFSIEIGLEVHVFAKF